MAKAEKLKKLFFLESSFKLKDLKEDFFPTAESKAFNLNEKIKVCRDVLLPPYPSDIVIKYSFKDSFTYSTLLEVKTLNSFLPISYFRKILKIVKEDYDLHYYNDIFYMNLIILLFFMKKSLLILLYHELELEDEENPLYKKFPFQVSTFLFYLYKEEDWYSLEIKNIDNELVLRIFFFTDFFTEE